MTTILAIEDESSILNNILETLEIGGFNAKGAQSGLNGITLAQEILPDLIICDIMMPELDGYGVLMKIRDNPLTATIPFIFLTARAEKSDMRKGMQIGADDYITKPFTPQELLAAVDARLERQASLAEEYSRKLTDLRQSIIHTMPHELNTPLTGILGYGEMLMMDYDTIEPDQILMMAGMIVRSGKRLHRLVENYLLYAQIAVTMGDPKKVNRIRQNSDSDNTRTVIEQVAKKTAANAERVADLTLELTDTPAQISEADLSKITEELISNAFKFSQLGTKVKIMGVSSSDSFMLCVADTGRGMTAEQLKNIGAYSQFERKLYEQQGSGLGLIISKRLTELHGGKFTIESVPNKGTRVCVEFLLPAE